MCEAYEAFTAKQSYPLCLFYALNVTFQTLLKIKEKKVSKTIDK